MSYPRSLPPSYESSFHRSQAHHETPSRNHNSMGPSFSYPPSPPFRHQQQQRRISADNAPLPNQPSPPTLEYYRESESQSRRYQYNSPPGPSPFYRSSSGVHYIDENMNPINDEALQFVSTTAIKSPSQPEGMRICADFVSEHFKCPICNDIFVETTVAACGHQFCRRCIATKPKCPICGSDVTDRIRVQNIDEVINSVSVHLSDEWKARRLRAAVETSPKTPAVRNTPQSGDQDQNVDTDADTDNQFEKYTRKAKRLVTKALDFLKNVLLYTLAGVLMIFEWLYENLTLTDLAKGTFVGCLMILLIYFNNGIVNFTQYLYYAAASYDPNIPAQQQIVAVMGVNANLSRFQDFMRLSDTIYARFIKIFYDYD